MSAWQAALPGMRQARNLVSSMARRRQQRLLAAWRDAAAHQAWKHGRVRRADRWHARRLQGCIFWGWQAAARDGASFGRRLAACVAMERLGCVLQAWQGVSKKQVQVEAAEQLPKSEQQQLPVAAQSQQPAAPDQAEQADHRQAQGAPALEGVADDGQLQRQALSDWKEAVLRRVQLRHLDHMLHRRKLSTCLEAWSSATLQRRKHAAASNALSAAYARVLMRWALEALRDSCHEAAARSALQRSAGRRLIGAWRVETRRRVRGRRLVGARRAAWARGMAAAMMAWRMRVVKLQLRDAATIMARLQVCSHLACSLMAAAC